MNENLSELIIPSVAGNQWDSWLRKLRNFNEDFHQNENVKSFLKDKKFFIEEKDDLFLLMKSYMSELGDKINQNLKKQKNGSFFDRKNEERLYKM